MKKLLFLISLTMLSMGLPAQIVISEIMYNPLGQNGVSGSELEFIELYNSGAQTINLAGYSFSEGITYTFPSPTNVAPGSFIVLARNSTALNTVYPSLTIAGQYLGALSNSGETIELINGVGETITSVTFENHAPWPILANGIGYSLVYTSGDQDKVGNWRNSSDVHGTPGAAASSNVAVYPLEINELLTNTNNLGVDKLELFNNSNQALDISGWFIGDNPDNPLQYQIPNNTILPANGYIVFDETQLGFGLSTDGDQVYVLSALGGIPTGWSTGYTFDAQEANRSFGQYTNSLGETYLTTLESQTFGSENSAPLIGPLVIEKIMYHPEETGTQYELDEFIVIKNISDSIIELNNTRLADSNAFQITGINYKFPLGENKRVQPDERIILTEILPATFRTKYNIPASTQIFQYTGSLSNSGETIQIRYPYSQDIRTDGSYDNHYVVMDEVKYNDKQPWPEAADGNGYYLARKGVVFGNDPSSWKAVKTPVLADDFNILALTSTEKSNLTLYPNPTHSQLYIDTDLEISSIQILDTQGNINRSVSNPHLIDLTAYSEGVYFLKIVFISGEVQTEKIVKH